MAKEIINKEGEGSVIELPKKELTLDRSKRLYDIVKGIEEEHSTKPERILIHPLPEDISEVEVEILANIYGDAGIKYLIKLDPKPIISLDYGEQ